MRTETFDSDSPLPLLVGLLCALALHVAMLPSATHWLFGVKTNVAIEELTLVEPAVKEKKTESQAKKKEVVPLGKDEAIQRTTMNWIGYEDYQKLLAQKAENDQAAFQRQMNPVTEAPPELDPEAVASNPTQPQPQPSPPEVSPRTPPVPPVPEVPSASTEVALAQVKPLPVILPPAVQEKGITTPVPQPLKTHTKKASQEQPRKSMPKKPNQPVIKPQEQTLAAAAAKAVVVEQPKKRDRPTSAVRDDRESAPFSIDYIKVKGKIGSVLVGAGIEIQTRQPRFTAVTLASAWPSFDPVVQITFDRDGTVLTCDLIRGSGYDGIDSAILTSCYFWKARGERLKKWNRKIVRRFTFRLGAKTID